MKFELLGKTKATLADIDIQSLKMGQTEVVPAVCLAFKVTLPNAKLSMLDKHLLGFLYAKASPGGNAQAMLEGVEVISDMPALTPAAEKIGPIGWEDEQTGCKLTIYRGATGDADIRLHEGTSKVKKITPREGGAVEFVITFYTSEVDAETLGELGVLKSHDLDIELQAPEMLSAKQGSIGGDKVTPIKGSKKPGKLGTDAEQAERQAEVLGKDPSQRGDWPLPGSGPKTPEEALAAGK